MEIQFVQIFAELQTQFLPSNLTTKQNGIIHTKSNSWQTWWFLLKFATEIQFWDEQLLHWQGPLSRGLNEAEAHRATDTSNRWSFEKLGIEAMRKTELPEPKSVWRARKPWTFEDSRARRSTENSEKCCCGDENVQKQCRCIWYMICWIFCAVYRDGGMPRSSHSYTFMHIEKNMPSCSFGNFGQHCNIAHISILSWDACAWQCQMHVTTASTLLQHSRLEILRHPPLLCPAAACGHTLAWQSFDCPGGVAWCYKHCCTVLYNLAENNTSWSVNHRNSYIRQSRMRPMSRRCATLAWQLIEAYRSYRCLMTWIPAAEKHIDLRCLRCNSSGDLMYKSTWTWMTMDEHETSWHGAVLHWVYILLQTKMDRFVQGCEDLT